MGGTHFPCGVHDLPCCSVLFCLLLLFLFFSIWGSSGALVRADQPLCLYLCVCVHTFMWLVVCVVCWALACFVHGVACVPESLEEHPGLCVSASMFASPCVIVYLCCV